jgi:transcription initiation factor TFIIF subunit beta
MEEEDWSGSDDKETFGIENQDVKAWLVKIPSFLSEKWRRIEEPGFELGRLRIYKKQTTGFGGNLNAKVTLHAIDYEFDEDEAPIPKNYNLNITNLTPKNEFIFTESTIGKAVEVFRY